MPFCPLPLLAITCSADLPKFYIDEATGDDNANDGSEALPYKSVLGAYIARGTEVDLFIRKKDDVVPSEPSTHTPAGTTASLSQSPWHPVTPSAVKKAKKLYDQHLKKQARAAELAEKEKEKAGLENKKLEESKSIVLEEPSTPAKKIKIRQGTQTRDTRVRVFGWVHRLRQQSGLTFIVLRDGTGYLQCVLSGKLVSTQYSIGNKANLTIIIYAGSNL